jgi:hypothetical protein
VLWHLEGNGVLRIGVGNAGDLEARGLWGCELAHLKAAGASASLVQRHHLLSRLLLLLDGVLLLLLLDGVLLLLSDGLLLLGILLLLLGNLGGCCRRRGRRGSKLGLRRQGSRGCCWQRCGGDGSH